MQKLFEEIEKPKEITWISDETWGNFSLKEKDYYIFRYIDGKSKSEVMRLLYLTSKWSFRNFLCKIKKKTKKDIEKVKKEIF